MKERIRKERSKQGRTQTAMSVRIDNDLVNWLQGLKNKGRYINNLIRADRKLHIDEDELPDTLDSMLDERP